MNPPRWFRVVYRYYYLGHLLVLGLNRQGHFIVTVRAFDLHAHELQVEAPVIEQEVTDFHVGGSPPERCAARRPRSSTSWESLCMPGP